MQIFHAFALAGEGQVQPISVERGFHLGRLGSGFFGYPQETVVEDAVERILVDRKGETGRGGEADAGGCDHLLV